VSAVSPVLNDQLVETSSRYSTLWWLAMTFAGMGEYSGALREVAAAAKLSDELSADSVLEPLDRVAELLASQVFNILSVAKTSLEELYDRLREVREQLDFDGRRRTCLGAWLQTVQMRTPSPKAPRCHRGRKRLVYLAQPPVSNTGYDSGGSGSKPSSTPRRREQSQHRSWCDADISLGRRRAGDGR
jgi:hypothetical protein